MLGALRCLALEVVVVVLVEVQVSGQGWLTAGHSPCQPCTQSTCGLHSHMESSSDTHGTLMVCAAQFGTWVVQGLIPAPLQGDVVNTTAVGLMLADTTLSCIDRYERHHHPRVFTPQPQPLQSHPQGTQGIHAAGHHHRRHQRG
jgi:hypothetical protein